MEGRSTMVLGLMDTLVGTMISICRAPWSTDHHMAPTTFSLFHVTGEWVLKSIIDVPCCPKVVNPLWWVHGSLCLRPVH